MANGKKNYFRHSFFARNDIKLLRLRDEVGVGFYFYFFSLLELCGEESSDELKEEYEFHHSTIRNLWGVNLKKSERVASVMNAVGLLEFEKREKSFVFKLPNFSKYLGKYTIKKESNTPNKRKEKEKKRKESKVKEKQTVETKVSPIVCDVVDYMNQKLGTQFRPQAKITASQINARHSEGYTLDNFKTVIDVKYDEWRNTDMAKHLNPKTLFREKHFDNYLNQQKPKNREDDLEDIFLNAVKVD